MTYPKEKAVIYAFLFLTLLVSSISIDLFPFSLNPLFTKRTDRFSVIQIFDKKGQRLSNQYFGTFLDYGSQFEKSGLVKTKSINSMGVFINEEVLIHQIKEKLSSNPGLVEVSLHLKNYLTKKSGVKLTLGKNIKILNTNFKENGHIAPDIYKTDKFFHSIEKKAFLND